MGRRGLISGEEEGEDEEARRGLGEAEEERGSVRGPAGKDEPEEDVAIGPPATVGKGGTADPTLAERWGRRCGWAEEA